MRKSSSFYRENGYQKMNGRYGDVIMFLIVTGVIAFGLVYIADQFRPVFDTEGNIVSTGIPIIVTIMSLVSLAYNSGIYYSSQSLFIDISEDVEFMVIEKIKSGFINNYTRNFALYFLVNFFAFLWALLFVIPGIVKYYSYSMAIYLAIKEPDIKGTDAITKSRKLMDGNKGDLFMLDLSYIGWYFLSILTFGILLLWVVPRHMTARTIFFNEVYQETLNQNEVKKNILQEPLF
ncbi:MAG TPA: DUF975 family protein [Bacillota bacterium]|nr:DUF975 family protein [Bacillota bacterium]